MRHYIVQTVKGWPVHEFGLWIGAGKKYLLLFTPFFRPFPAYPCCSSLKRKHTGKWRTVEVTMERGPCHKKCWNWRKRLPSSFFIIIIFLGGRECVIEELFGGSFSLFHGSFPWPFSMTPFSWNEEWKSKGTSDINKSLPPFPKNEGQHAKNEKQEKEWTVFTVSFPFSKFLNQSTPKLYNYTLSRNKLLI